MELSDPDFEDEEEELECELVEPEPLPRPSSQPVEASKPNNNDGSKPVKLFEKKQVPRTINKFSFIM